MKDDVVFLELNYCLKSVDVFDFWDKCSILVLCLI